MNPNQKTNTDGSVRKLLTLVFVRDGNRILLGMKKRGFGQGRWNGFGGKVEADESIEDAAHRELSEEAGIKAGMLRHCGVLDFSWAGKPGILEVHVFEVQEWAGEPSESDEMRPQWFSLDAIPFDEMWSDDPFWFPLYVAGKEFQGQFLFDEKDAVIKHKIQQVS